jgi:hypothetical protein
MPRTRRHIQPGRPYELILRVKEGLPFRPSPLINTLLNGIIARAQRDNKVTLCHYLWMSNHIHIIIIAKCPLATVHFYQEIQKKVTDTFKRLFGKRRLSLWEGDAVLAQILDIDKAIDRVAYLYANPARANLVESIDDYPGASSWNQFISEKKESPCIPWIQLPSIKKLPSLYLNQKDEVKILNKLSSESVTLHKITLEPNALIAAFGHQGDCKQIIIQKIREKEKLANQARHSEKKLIPSKELLLNQQINRAHSPKKRLGERRIFVLSSIKSLRINYIYSLKEFCRRCTECYKKSMLGIGTVRWPVDAFRPFLPPMLVVNH